MKDAITPLLCALVVCGCETTYRPPSPPPVSRLVSMPTDQLTADALKVVVDASDGISRVEAYRIALDFCRLPEDQPYASFPHTVVDEDSLWRVPLVEPLHGYIVGAIIIRKTDGLWVTEGVGSRMVQTPNKAPEPTPGLVTPRALE